MAGLHDGEAEKLFEVFKGPISLHNFQNENYNGTITARMLRNCWLQTFHVLF